ncbi:hypothetical protein [Frankia sp. Cas4]|uniref:hypothetical protein n=1 Tax=Frankia sp. Cas4 TaxID=3073927 RepID=UPI002AD3FBE0|nr:hypothetical protein [Frankia sp. Cas4]
MTDLEKYTWAESVASYDAGVYTFVKGGVRSEILPLFRCWEEDLQLLPITDVPWGDGGDTFVSLMPQKRHEWLVIGEHGTHFRGFLLLEELSRGRSVLLVALPQINLFIQVVVDGEIVRSFNAWSTYDPAGALPEEAGLPFGSTAGTKATFAFIERLTGHEMTQQWMLGPCETARARSESPH